MGSLHAARAPEVRPPMSDMRAKVGTEFKIVSLVKAKDGTEFKTVSREEPVPRQTKPCDGCEDFYADETPMPGGRRRSGEIALPQFEAKE